MPDRRSYSRQDVLQLVLDAADRHALSRVEFLGGMIAEGLDVYASRPADPADWRRYWEGVTPQTRFDVSFGLGQKNARYSDEYAAWCRSQGFEANDPRADAYPGDDVIATIRDAYFDPVHALNVAAKGYRHWRYDPEVEPVRAWVAYNGPAYYYDWLNSPNLANYREGLAEAARILGAIMPPPPAEPAYNPNVPREVQINKYTCSIRTVAWMLKALGAPASIDELHDRMVPALVTPEDGLLNQDGYGEGVERVLKERTPASWHPRIKRYEDLTFDQAKSLVLRGPLGVGGRQWGHWSPLSGLNDDGTLAVKNTAGGGWQGVTDRLSEDDWKRLGPFGGVWVDAMPAATPAKPPAAGQPEQPPTSALLAQLADKTARLDAEVSKLGYVSGDAAEAAEAIARAATALAATLRSLKPRSD